MEALAAGHFSWYARKNKEKRKLDKLDGLDLRGALSTMIASVAAVWGARLAIPYLRSAKAKSMPDWALKNSAFLVISALILHDVPEGFAMANAYLASPEVGVLVALAIALHNVPEEFAMAVPAVTIRSKRFLFGAALLSALAEPLGAIIGLAAVGVAPSLNAHFLAFAAGAMLFVSIRELMPMAKRYRHLGWFGGGMILSVFVYGLLARITVGQTRLIPQ